MSKKKVYCEHCTHTQINNYYLQRANRVLSIVIHSPATTPSCCFDISFIFNAELWNDHPGWLLCPRFPCKNTRIMTSMPPQ